MDPSWDAIWYARSRITPQGWVVEMQIPYSMLRFSDAATQTWGLHFTRRIPRLGEQSEWPHVPRTERTNLVARFGHLAGITNVKPKRNLQVSPYTLSRLLTKEHPDKPGSMTRQGSFDVGGDMKIGLGPNVTLDATINPDFGQVESDPAVLNLTAFETVFEERRPFFTEGMQIYDFDVGPGQLPYSRRIGAQAPIIGAAKLSGRTTQGLSFGVLGASTGDNFDPTRHYGIVRVNQQLRTYSSTGGILTAFDGPALDENGRLRSLVAGVDYNFRFRGNRYGLEGFAGFTHRRWTNADYGPETGFGGKFLWRKRQGAWTGFGGIEGFDGMFNMNDVGRLQRNNYFVIPLRIEYDINEGQPFGPFLRASIGDFASQQFSWDEGLNLGQRHRFSSNWTLRGFQQIELGATLDYPFGGYDIYETRGLGPWARPFGVEVQGEFQTDERRSWQVEPEFGFTAIEDGGRVYGVGLRGNANVGTRLSLSGNLEVQWEDDVVAWASNETFVRTEGGWMIGEEAGPPDELSPADLIAFDDLGLLDAILADVEPFDEDWYYVPVFGARDTRSLDFTLRSTVTFTPNLSLQLYSQLFLARGRYHQFQILQHQDDLVSFESFPKRDEFAFSNLQSNVVLRWEYRPGSTLYLVWTHGRNAEDDLNPLAPRVSSPYDTPIGRQVADTFDIFPSNVFLIKLSYTFLR